MNSREAAAGNPPQPFLSFQILFAGEYENIFESNRCLQKIVCGADASVSEGGAASCVSQEAKN